MDVAKRIARWLEQSPEQGPAAVNRYLPPIVTAALVALGIYHYYTAGFGIPADVPAGALIGAMLAVAAVNLLGGQYLVGPVRFAQRSARARSRAVVVLPMPRGPAKR